MRPPLELHRPTILNIAAIVCYCLAMMFHIIAYATDSWSSMHLEGVTWSMGLWHGCRQDDTDDTWHCSTEIFNDKVFKTGKSSDWHLGSRVMMTLALIILFLLEFAIIGYACIKNLEKHKSRLVGIVIGLSVSAAFCHFLTLIMYGSEVEKVPDSSVKGSFGIVVISLLLEIAIPVLVRLDKYMRYPSDNVYIVSEKYRDKTDSSKKKTYAENPTFTIEDHSFRSRAPPASMRTSVSSLSETETYKKFAYMEEPPSSVGSVGSLVTRTTEMTNMSYQSDTQSYEITI